MMFTGSSAPTTMHNESTHTEVHHKYNRMEYKMQLKSMKRAYRDIGLEGQMNLQSSTPLGDTKLQITY